MGKCTTCNKNITKKVFGIVCSRCEKSVHATHECAKLSNKQLATLRNTPGLEWSCADCLCNASRRSSTFVSIDESENEEEEEAPPRLSKEVSSKLLQEITSEMKKVFKKEFEEFKREFEVSLNFLGEQITSLEECVKNQDSRIKALENKNTDLQNKNKNLELRVACVEIQMQEMEQKALSNTIEISGLPEISLKTPQDTVKSVACKLKVDINAVASTRCMPIRKDHPSSLLVELKTGESREQWISSAKRMTPTVGDVVPNASHEVAKNPVYVREALTPHNKMSLYNAKKNLRETHEFIWCKNGKIFVRKTKASKVHVIRNMSDNVADSVVHGL